MQLPKIAQSLLTPLNHRHALAMSFFFFGSRPLESNAMGYLGWSRKACRILVLYKKKKKIKKIKSPVHKTKGKKQILYNDFSKKNCNPNEGNSNEKQSDT